MWLNIGINLSEQQDTLPKPQLKSGTCPANDSRGANARYAITRKITRVCLSRLVNFTSSQLTVFGCLPAIVFACTNHRFESIRLKGERPAARQFSLITARFTTASVRRIKC